MDVCCINNTNLVTVYTELMWHLLPSQGTDFNTFTMCIYLASWGVMNTIPPSFSSPGVGW